MAATRFPLLAVFILLQACQAQTAKTAEASGPVPGPGKLYVPGVDKPIDIQIVGSKPVNSKPVEASSLSATGIPDPVSGGAFWMLGISTREIVLQGAASTRPPELVRLPPVKSTVRGDAEIWVTQDGETNVRIEAQRERCVRPDGFVFRNRVTVQIGNSTLSSCGKRGSDPAAVRT